MGERIMDITGLGSLFDFGSKVLERIFPNPADRLAAQTKLAELQQTGELAQLAAETDLAKGQQAINLEEAKSSSLFVSGWRPAVGWTCAAAFAYHFVLQPLLAFLMASMGHPVTLPTFDMGALSTVLMGMLGLGGLRSFDKLKGTTK